MSEKDKLKAWLDTSSFSCLSRCPCWGRAINRPETKEIRDTSHARRLWNAPWRRRARALDPSHTEAELDWLDTDDGQRTRVWVVTYEGVEIPLQGSPETGDRCMSEWDVVLDARTGDLISAGNEGVISEC